MFTKDSSEALIHRNHNLLDVADNPDVSSHLVHLQNRITQLMDHRVRGSVHEDDIIHLYSNSLLESNEEIARCGAFDHTMFTSIDEYCSQKFPVEYIRQGLLDGWKLEIHGIFPEHFISISRRIGYTEVKEVTFSHNKRIKKFNFMRPKFFECIDKNGQKVFIVAVNSGRDYVFHYASMLRHIVGKYSHQMAEAIKVYRYPLAESCIHIWTGLDSRIITEGDIVVLGYVEEMSRRIQEDPDLKKIDNIDTPYYTSTRYINKQGSYINFVGIKYSFWGCISAKVSTQICRLGAQEIIYIGKLGTLSSPTDIYDRIFVPSQFLIMYQDTLVCDIQGLKNNFLEYRPELSTGRHTSVPTVVEEDYTQRAVAHSLNITSIDNEVSQIAYAIDQFNRQFNKAISYSALHFATDYIRKPQERSLEVKFDLSNNRSKEAFSKKIAILDNIGQELISYLKQR